MRRLTRGPEPTVLINNSTSWTDDYKAAAAGGTARLNERWRHDDIRTALASDASGKCMYCESKVADVGFPNVEHIRPKSQFPAEAHLWSNLGFACIVCNVAKLDYWSAGAEVVDPYRENPDEFLVFHGDFVTAVTGSVRGRISRNKLDLQRAPLIASRLSRLEAVLKAVEEWQIAPEPLKTMLAHEIERDVHAGEYSASVISVLEKQGFPLAE